MKSVRNIILSLWLLSLELSLLPAVFAETAKHVPDDQTLGSLQRDWEMATTQYREALKAKKNAVSKEIKRTQNAIEGEKDQNERQKIMEKMKSLTKEHEELSDKIRVISAGEVVRLSNTKDKVVAFLTHQ